MTELPFKPLGEALAEWDAFLDKLVQDLIRLGEEWEEVRPQAYKLIRAIKDEREK